MSLSEQSSKYFGSNMRRNGANYFNENKVAKINRGNLAASTQVRGTKNYRCLFKAEIKTTQKKVFLTVRCDCPYFEKGLCKHLWASLLALEANAWLKKAAEKNKIVVEADRDDEDEEDDFDDEDEDFDSSESFYSPFSVASTPKSIPWSSFKNSLSVKVTPPEILHLKNSQFADNRDKLLCFTLDQFAQNQTEQISLRFHFRERLKSGKLGTFKPTNLSLNRAQTGLSEDDQEIFSKVIESADGFLENRFNISYHQRGLNTASSQLLQGILIPQAQVQATLGFLSERGRLFFTETGVRKPHDTPLSVSHKIWNLVLRLVDHNKQNYRLQLDITNGDVSNNIKDVRFFGNGRYFVENNVLCMTVVAERQLQSWIKYLSRTEPIVVKRSELHNFIEQYSVIPNAPEGKWPDDFDWREQLEEFRPKLRLKPSLQDGLSPFDGELLFQYPRADVTPLHPERAWVDKDAKVIYLRDTDREQSVIGELLKVKGVRPAYRSGYDDRNQMVSVSPIDLVSAVDHLDTLGWDVEVEKQKIKILRDFEIAVEGTIDWFDLSITTTVDSVCHSLPSLLKKKKSGESFVRLGKDELAIIPEEWLRRYELLSQSGQLKKDQIRVGSERALLLESLLSDVPVVDKSQHFAKIREKVKQFKTLVPSQPHKTFKGTLRDYQSEGLSWLKFLQEFGFGGCLADDMGLGKTIQVLALLLDYHSSPRPSPSLVVVPRSLVGNWLDEAQRFCPKLRMRDASGTQRDWTSLENIDVILITYGTLRQDIGALALINFSYVILDESQAIKNQASLTAKASYALRAKHRLAMSGTPVENHLGELNSLLSFLNPGLVDGSFWAQALQKKASSQDPNFKLLTQAIKPLILRRTKSQVLKDLPPKIENTLYCELDGVQREQYDELLEHYRANLLPKLGEQDWKRSSIVIIEALLRLRQAACHPGLIDNSMLTSGSAKLDVLLEKLEEVREGGHKALIFSQFTGFLKILADQLTANKIPFEYLDGKTRDRSARVDRFQKDSKIPFFLISLKAGGVGLNLTAADYCFILDPWWNPAAESQAIDRAHRINQKNTVFAYRLIAKNTIEEKIQQMQASKRAIADSILEGDGSLMQNLDLETIRALFF
ncbi:MAG: hypothetical protein EOP10_00735 [Proteobacteria bacterium]|nr:MAG: hypothetical protein EOP10_00735 [Pseudomonadota bacterium]